MRQHAGAVLGAVDCSAPAGTIASVTPQSAAAAAGWPVRELDVRVEHLPKTLRRARVLELSGWAFYVAGRGGVLGDDVRADTVGRGASV